MGFPHELLTTCHYNEISYADVWDIVSRHLYGKRFDPDIHDNAALRDRCIEYLVELNSTNLIEIGSIKQVDGQGIFEPIEKNGVELRNYLQSLLPSHLHNNLDEGFRCWYVLTDIGRKESDRLWKQSTNK
ncbi:MAG: hypothetical protein L3J02_06465 [Henriciella sp.]|nr:hypothetical protein [Henriciella sp.]